jgi:predicted  nucleic acid-binding Zn-ribbon protein
MLALLHTQLAMITALDREVVHLARRSDRLENECDDLEDEIKALCATIKRLAHWRDDDDDHREDAHV